MAIFLDTSNIEEVKEYNNKGIIRGVTTNPSILVKQGIVSNLDSIANHCLELARLVAPLPLSVEVTSNDKEEMIAQAQFFVKLSPNINIKIPIHGPQGELHNLEVVKELETKHNIRVNVTAMMSAQQCFLAALAGASYVSLFGGRVNNMGYNTIQEIKKLRTLLDMHHLKAKIIMGSTREVLNVVEWLGAGAHIVTVAPQFLKGMIVHPYSKETVQMFLNDAK